MIVQTLFAGPRWRSWRVAAAAALSTVTLLAAAGCTSNAVIPAGKGAISQGNGNKFMIVNCLLPAQVKKLGTQLTYLAPRRPVRTSAADCEIRGGEYVAYDRADYATALKVWLPQAKRGDPKAQNYVGQIYEQGLGLPPDYVTAATWYRKAADQGYAPAQINLGHLYEKGLGVTRSPTEAINWYRRASGLKSNKLMFASAVAAAKVSQSELQKLRRQVSQAQEHAERYRRQLTHVRKTLAAKEGQIRKLNADQKDKQQLLDLLKQQSPSAKRDDEVKRLHGELTDYKQQLADSRQQVEQLKQQEHHYDDQVRRSVDAVNAARKASPPQIALIDPPVNATRGIPRAELQPAVRTKQIVGKVNAPAGVQRFTINGRDQALDKFNLFWATVQLTGDVTPVNLSVLDKQRHEVKYDFLIQSPRRTAPAAPPLSTAGLHLGKFHALIIGNDDYKALPRLKTPVNDARSVARLLHDRYGYTTHVLINATRYQILSALNDLRRTLTAQDNLLIYYAGHGEIDSVTQHGYWLPVDAAVDNPATWISNAAISDMIDAMQATHIMVVADSCYSGTLSGEALPQYSPALPVVEQKEWLQTVMGLRARTVLTSGGVEPVLDTGVSGKHSIFAQAFLSALQRNKHLLEGYALYRSVLRAVSDSAAALNTQQTPEYAPIMHAGHEAGEYFFEPV